MLYTQVDKSQQSRPNQTKGPFENPKVSVRKSGGLREETPQIIDLGTYSPTNHPDPDAVQSSSVQDHTYSDLASPLTSSLVLKVNKAVRRTVNPNSASKERRRTGCT